MLPLKDIHQCLKPVYGKFFFLRHCRYLCGMSAFLDYMHATNCLELLVLWPLSKRLTCASAQMSMSRLKTNHVRPSASLSRDRALYSVTLRTSTEAYSCGELQTMTRFCPPMMGLSPWKTVPATQNSRSSTATGIFSAVKPCCLVRKTFSDIFVHCFLK